MNSPGGCLLYTSQGEEVRKAGTEKTTDVIHQFLRRFQILTDAPRLDSFGTRQADTAGRLVCGSMDREQA